MSIDIAFTVLGLPQPGGSKRAFPFKGKDGRLHVSVSDANPKAKSWMLAVAMAARAAIGENAPLLTSALELSVTFTFPRPKGHYGSGRNAGKVKASAPQYHTTRPDRTKLLRALEDALTGVLWKDDAQVVDGPTTKLYGEVAGAHVRVCTLPSPWSAMAARLESAAEETT